MGIQPRPSSPPDGSCSFDLKKDTMHYTPVEKVFVLLDDLRVNNIDRRFRSLTIKWLEELCANFIRTMFFKK